MARSIVFVAVEILHGWRGRPGLAERKPCILALLFGLLHWLRFAGALSAAVPRENAIPRALLFFNLGVVDGQIVFVLGIRLAMWASRSLGIYRPRWCETAPVYAPGTTAMYWMIDRTMLMVAGRCLHTPGGETRTHTPWRRQTREKA